MRIASAGRFAGHSLNSVSALTALALLSALSAATLTGCGIGDVSTSSSTAASVIPPLTGKIMGGQTPILNATVKIYTTGVISTPCTSSACAATDAGYGQGTFLQEATATAQPIPGIWITNGGSNYTQPPVITFSGGGGGTGAAATAFLGSGASAGQVVGITVTSSGSGYTSAPTVIFTPASGDTTGAGAAATTGYGGYDAPGGNFSFAGGYYCPAGEFAYIVASGGQPGNTSNAPNSAIELVAALGRCEDLYTLTGGVYTGYTGQPVTVNELTTLAAAYALGNFSSTVSNGVVTFGAPATNNAPQVSGISTGTTTKAAGLYHAFLNAKNLADPTNPSVQLTAPTNPVGNSSAILPTALMNTIANVLANCVNSTSTNAQCTGLPGGADIFTAAKTLAANPTFSGSSSAVTAFYNLPTGSAQFSPILAAAPNDYSIAIDYPATGTTISYPMSGALDVNDNFYIGNATYNTASAGTPTTPVNVVSFSSSGAYGSSPSAAGFSDAYSLAIDSNGKGWIGNGGTGASSGIGYFTSNNAGVSSATTITAASVVTSAHSGLIKVYALAVDRSNNIWAFGVQQTNGLSNLYRAPSTFVSGLKTWVAQPSPQPEPLVLPASNFIGLAIDPNQNVWTTAGTTVTVVENTGTASAGGQTYTVSSPTSATASGSPAEGIAFTGTASATKAWISSYNTTAGIQLFTPTYDTNTIGVKTIASSTFVQPTSVTGTLFNEADGAGTVWLADYNSSSVQAFNPTSSAAYKYLPCIGGSTTCTSAFASPGKPISVAIDSTGSIWVTVPMAGSVATTASPGSIVQIIGSAAPTWPLLSLGMLGKP